MKKDFDLEKAARDWRRQIETVPAFTESDCRQFESDLLDMADEMTSQGMAEEEAFMIASERYRQMLAGSQSQLKQFNEGWLDAKSNVGTFRYFSLFFLLFLYAGRIKSVVYGFTDLWAPAF